MEVMYGSPYRYFIKGNFTSIFLKEWKYGDGKKNRVRDYCRFWLYYTQNMKKSRFPKRDVYKRQFVEYSRPIVFGEDRLRERGSLPATFYVLKGYFYFHIP